MSSSLTSNSSAPARFWLARAVEGQKSYMAAALAFIVVIALALPDTKLLTPGAGAHFLMFLGVATVYGMIAHLLTHYARTRSLHDAITFGLRPVIAPDNLRRAAPTLFVIACFVFAFAAFKARMPDLTPYSLDAGLAEMDLALHFGTAPWEWIAAVTGYGRFTQYIDDVYYLWFPVTFGAAAAAALTPGNPPLRHRFLFAFALCWIVIGCLAATLLWSAGPIYYDRLFGGPSQFTALTAQLEAVAQTAPLRALEARDALWAVQTGEAESLISGISAMPSMHNSICVLLFLAARHVSRALATAAALFALAIFLGSVHLGWHYAVDGYAAAILTAFIWKIAGLMTAMEASQLQAAPGMERVTAVSAD